MAGHYDARVLTIEVSVGGKKKEALSKPGVLGTISHFMRRHAENPESVRKLIVLGKDYDEESSRPLDLLSERIVAEAEIPLEGRMLSPRALRYSIVAALMEKAQELKNYPIL
ncbi:MAG: hypothetical protein M1598_04570 [Actinobacteria bacterium]|nr:hypothetical protein [Actinomycetota bacterium]